MKSAILGLVVFALAITGFIIFSSLTSSTQRISWETDYHKAVEKAKVEKKPIILFFTGSDWCVWCTRLEKEVFNTDDFVTIAKDKYIFVKLDFPMNKEQDPSLAQQNQKLQEKYSIEGFPTLVILSNDESYLGTANYEAGGGRKYAALLEKTMSRQIAEKKAEKKN